MANGSWLMVLIHCPSAISHQPSAISHQPWWESPKPWWESPNGMVDENAGRKGANR
jgi:hypothetical protein